MKLDKRHLVASVVVLVGSIVYNVWVFTRPAAGVRATPIAGASAGDPGTAIGNPGAVAALTDPSQFTPLADVDLDRQPEWPRDPFAHPKPYIQPVADTAAGPSPEPIAEVDPVVGSILYSPDRRLAMIEGRIVREGDVVGDITVIEIRPTEVVVESPTRGRRTLSTRAGGSAR